MSTRKERFVLPGDGLERKICQELSFLSQCDISAHRLAVLVMQTVEGVTSEEAVELEIVATRPHDDEALHAAQAIDLTREQFRSYLCDARQAIEARQQSEATGQFHFDQWLPNGDFSVIYDPDCTMVPLGP